MKKNSVLNDMDWYESIELVNTDNKVIDIGDEIDDDSDTLSSIGFSNERIDWDNFSIGTDW